MVDKKDDFDSLIRTQCDKIQQLRKKQKGGEKNGELLAETNYLYSLLEITRSINIPRDFNQLLELVVDSAITVSNAERGFLMLFGKNGNLEFKVIRNIDRKILEGEEFRISRTVVNHVLATGEPLFLSSIYKDKRFITSESIEALGLRMVMCVPLKARETLLGLIYVDSRSETDSFTQLEKKMFEAFAAQASVTIENSHLYESSVRDALTGLYNYGYLRVRLEEEITRAARANKDNISFVMLDLDNFKSINDSYGHILGNSILVKVADIVKESVRKYDVAARYGGDEFAILMPNATIEDAQHLAERLKISIANVKFYVGRETFSISASIGISTFPIDKISNSESVIVEADHALFRAKGKGGNQIAVFGLRKDRKKREPELVGKSQVMDEVKKTISKLARTDATVLITGETGTGKELITQLIHHKSSRATNPFIVINCGAIPDNLLESELFGYEKGAFTGAFRLHKGKFETAHTGTIFLDEIAELPLHLQVKLLRVIEQKEIDRIGSKKPIQVDVRIIAASNKNLEDELKKESFRKDLFFRLSVATIHIPPLRDRAEDIDALSEYYLKQMNSRYRTQFKGFTDGAREAMLNHLWPGNVRELIHRIERAVIMSTEDYVNENDLGLLSPEFKSIKFLKKSRDELEKRLITQALIINHWNVTRASKTLGMTRRGLRYLIQKHKIVKHH
jgi:diguanylate cyclase (GGDEF)-like protein